MLDWYIIIIIIIQVFPPDGERLKTKNIFFKCLKIRLNRVKWIKMHVLEFLEEDFC